jgi:hypothetical protein
VGNEKNGYPVPDLKKTTMNETEEPSEAHKTKQNKKPNPSKKISGKKSLRNSWRRCLVWTTRMYKMHSRNLKTPKTKNMR